MTLSKKILSSQVVMVVVPACIITVAAVWQARSGFQRATRDTHDAFESNGKVTQQALLDSGLSDLAHQAQGVYAMCASQQEAVERIAKDALRVAQAELTRAGGLKFADQSLNWNAKDQATGTTTAVNLPAPVIAGQPLQQNTDPSTASPVVDTVRELVGTTCTIFQRMNPAGDMLRVCTNVTGKDGQRAIGTYIAARGADGTTNPVLAHVLAGEPYTGRAYVVDRWYITAYDPIKDANNDVVGMLYTGVPQESAASLRKAIMATKVGKTGYVYVLNTKGDTRGQYVISYEGKRDGENIWDTRDADGRYVIREICEAAAKLKPGEIGEIKYNWKNKDDAQAREKIVKLAYFEPWDWVIGVGAYADEFYEAVTKLNEQSEAALAGVENAQRLAQTGVVRWCTGIGIGAAFFAVLVALWITRSITRPVNRIVNQLTDGADQVRAAAAQVSSASQELATGASEQASSLEETSSSLEEMAAMTRTNADNANKANNLALQARGNAGQGDQTMRQLNGAMAAINASANKISSIIKVIEEIAFQTNLLALNAAVEAARAGEHGKGFAVVAEEVRNLAQRCAQAAKDTTSLIDDSVQRAKEGTSVADLAANALQGIARDVAQVAELMGSITAASNEQAQGVEQINLAVSQIDKITQQNAAGAEESAAAAEQLNAQAETLKTLTVDLTKLVGVNTTQVETAPARQVAPPRAAMSYAAMPVKNSAAEASDQVGDF